MASRSNSGMGVLVALVIFIMLTITLLLLVMLFYTKADKEAQLKDAAETAAREFIRSEERNRDDIVRLKSEAQEKSMSVVMYLRTQMQDLMRDVAGNQNLSPSRLRTQLDQLGLREGESLTGFVTTLSTQVSDRDDRIKALENELAAAHTRLGEEVARREELQRSQEAALAAANAEIDRVKQRADRYQQQVLDSERDMQDRVRDIRAQLDAEIASLKEQIERRDVTIAELTDNVRALQSRVRGVTQSNIDEGSQVDGHVVRLVGNDEVFIDLGKPQHLVLGMTFNVYGSISEMRPDAQGNVPQGKATVEVTRIGETTSTARIIRSTPGRAVVEGDVIVNPVYDRNKKYSFFLFGQFDLDGENGPSEFETEIVRSRIREWGGELRSEFAGDMDFLVLGVEPALPAEPRPNATGPEVIAYRRARQFYEDYNAHLDRAQRLSIPVLNQNRLLTLIGYYGN
ncbi:MAG: hypothetical protein KJZ69_07225 [Phycisphaerales bacterium]|nr:hypothetical protein [Phycisphaerales bacterium]